MLKRICRSIKMIQIDMKKHLIYSVFLVIIFGCEEILLEEDISENVVRLVAPSDGSLVTNTSVTFSWEGVDQATSYRLQIARPAFENATQIIEDTTVTTTNFSTILVKNDYEWRVRAQNSGSQTAYENAGFSVVDSEDFTAREVVLSLPSDNSIVNSASTTLQWSVVTDATLYRVQILNTSDEIIQESTTTANSIQKAFRNGRYEQKTIPKIHCILKGR